MGIREEEGKLTDLLQTEIIERGEKDGKRSVNSHYPSECETVVRAAQQHSWFRNHLPWPHKCFP